MPSTLVYLFSIKKLIHPTKIYHGLLWDRCYSRCWGSKSKQKNQDLWDCHLMTECGSGRKTCSSEAMDLNSWIFSVRAVFIHSQIFTVKSGRNMAALLSGGLHWGRQTLIRGTQINVSSHPVMVWQCVSTGLTSSPVTTTNNNWETYKYSWRYVDWQDLPGAKSVRFPQTGTLRKGGPGQAQAPKQTLGEMNMATLLTSESHSFGWERGCMESP